MPAKRPLVDGPTNRKRTADALRRLREITRQIRLLKADIETATDETRAPRLRRRR